MIPEPRPYHDEADVAALRAVLVAGRQAQPALDLPGTYSVHPGDLAWWLDYLNQEYDRRTHIFLWEEAGRVLAWSLLSPHYRAFDVFARPELRGSEQWAHMWAWTEARLQAALPAEASRALRTMWVADDDEALIALLESRGFAASDDYIWSLARSLAADLPEPCLPAGFAVRPLRADAEAEVAARAQAAHAAFSVSLPLERYTARYQCFVRSPSYAQALDLVVVPALPVSAAEPVGESSPGVAAFAVVWLDPANGVGLFEPVGTHPAFRRRGLAKALLQTGLRAMQAAGMHTALVGAEHDNPSAIGLYESVGFRAVRKIVTYEKRGQ